jgi:hypothetical protein
VTLAFFDGEVKDVEDDFSSFSIGKQPGVKDLLYPFFRDSFPIGSGSQPHAGSKRWLRTFCAATAKSPTSPIGAQLISVLKGPKCPARQAYYNIWFPSAMKTIFMKKSVR